MSVQEPKDQISVLPREEQNELMAFLFHLRHREDPDWTGSVTRRSRDKDPSHWLSPYEFGRQLDQRPGR